MLIIGAGGLAKDLVCDLKTSDKFYFFDDVTEHKEVFIDGSPIIKSKNDVKQLFQSQGANFCVAIGGGSNRQRLEREFTDLGGNFTSVISDKADIGKYGVNIGEGCLILKNCIISNDVSIQKGSLIYFNVSITHDCFIGEYAELAPGATLLGKCYIEENVFIGANATILPNIHVGRNSIIGAGAVVTKDVPSNCVVAGNPAKILRYL